MTAYEELLEWLKEDRESRFVEITIACDDPDWPLDIIDPTDDDMIWTFSYLVEATETVYWDEVDSSKDCSWRGKGASIELACTQVRTLMHADEL